MCTFCKICIPDGRDRVIRWCNAPEYVRVSVKNGEGKEVAHMKVVLKFTGTTDKGRFDCMAIKEGVERSARDDRVREVKEAVGGKRSRLERRVQGMRSRGTVLMSACINWARVLNNFNGDVSVGYAQGRGADM